MLVKFSFQKLRSNSGEKKNEMMKFLAFSKIWRKFLEIYFFQNKFFFFKKIYFKKFSPKIWRKFNHLFFIP